MTGTLYSSTWAKTSSWRTHLKKEKRKKESSQDLHRHAPFHLMLQNIKTWMVFQHMMYTHLNLTSSIMWPFSSKTDSCTTTSIDSSVVLTSWSKTCHVNSHQITQTEWDLSFEQCKQKHRARTALILKEKRPSGCSGSRVNTKRMEQRSLERNAFCAMLLQLLTSSCMQLGERFNVVTKVTTLNHYKYSATKFTT